MQGTLVHPPEILKLLAHEIRWTLLHHLARSDYRVQELVAKLQLPQNLVSYHLRQLRSGHIITERRSNADERSVYYSLDLEQLLNLYLDVADELHPALRAKRQSEFPQQWDLPQPPLRVLFLCTENSARSQMAEALLRHLSCGDVQVESAGSSPGERVHPFALRVMQEAGIDMSHAAPKHLDLFREERFDAIVTVCDRAREVCPTFPGEPEHIHWSLQDPALIQGSEEVRFYAFKQTAEQLTSRLRFLLPLLEQAYKDARGQSA